MDIPQSWQELSALAERAIVWLGSLSIPGLRMVDAPLLLSILLLLIITLILMRQRRRMKHTEQARNNAEALASCLFDALPDAATITDPEGRFLSVNPAFAQLVGREEREIAGALLTDLFTPAVAERFQYRPVEGEEDEFCDTFRIRADHPARFRAHKTPLFDTEGLMIGVLTQLSPVREATRLARPVQSRPKRGQRSAGVRTTPVNIEIGSTGESPSAQTQGQKLDKDSRSPGQPPLEPTERMLPPDEDVDPYAAQDGLGTPPPSAYLSGPKAPSVEEAAPNLVEALQLAVRISTSTGKEPPSTGQGAGIDGQTPPEDHDPHPLASSQFEHPPKDDPHERSLKGLRRN